MSRICRHNMIWGRCPRCELDRLATIYEVGAGFLRSQPTTDGPVRLNLDRFGMPRDYASYVWLVYKREVVDESPARRAFLNGPRSAFGLPPADPMLMGYEYK